MVTMSEIYLLIDVLRQAVPGAYLLMCLYLGFVGYQSPLSWAFLTIFGVLGLSSYMLLNESFFWLPIWITNEHLFAATLIAMLLVGVGAFTLAIEWQDLDWPWERALKWRDKLKERVRRGW